MNDLRAFLLGHIEKNLDAMGAAPRMWGSPESLELQALMLLELKTMLLRPHSMDNNPGEMRDSYDRFVTASFPSAPSTLLSYILRGRDEQFALPKYIQKFRRIVERELPEEDPYKNSDLLLEIAVRGGDATPSFSTVCGYYERFQKALQSMVRKSVPKGAKERDVVAHATEYPVPNMRVVPRSDGGASIQVPLEQPQLGQMGLYDGESLTASAVRKALSQALGVVAWADGDAPEIEALKTVYPGDVHRKELATHAIRMLPGQDITVRLGGRLVGVDKSIELRPEQAPRILPVLKEGEKPKRIDYSGTVRAVDLDQKWFRIRHGDTTIKCWAPANPEWLQQAADAMANKARVRVVGDEFRPSSRRPFVETMDLQAA